jgi:prevent-host-death family protein
MTTPLTRTQTAHAQTVGIRELKQNPSEIIAKAATGVRFEVLSNGKPAGVIIQRDASVRSRWVSTDALVGLSSPASADSTGWVDDLRAARALDDDRIVDPWERAEPVEMAEAEGTRQNAAEA